MSSKRESTCQRASNGVKPEDGTAYADGLAYPKFEALKGMFTAKTAL